MDHYQFFDNFKAQQICAHIVLGCEGGCRHHQVHSMGFSIGKSCSNRDKLCPEVTDKNTNEKMESHYGITYNDTSLESLDSEPELEEKLNFIENGTDFNCDLECSSALGTGEKDLSWPIFCLVGSGLILFISIAGYVIISKFDHRRLSSCAHARMSEKTPLTIHNNENTLSPIDNRQE